MLRSTESSAQHGVSTQGLPASIIIVISSIISALPGWSEYSLSSQENNLQEVSDIPVVILRACARMRTCLLGDQAVLSTPGP